MNYRVLRRTSTPDLVSVSTTCVNWLSQYRLLFFFSLFCGFRLTETRRRETGISERLRERIMPGRYMWNDCKNYGNAFVVGFFFFWTETQMISFVAVGYWITRNDCQAIGNIEFLIGHWYKLWYSYITSNFITVSDHPCKVCNVVYQTFGFFFFFYLPSA